VGVLGRAVIEGGPVSTADALADDMTYLSDDLEANFRASGEVAVLAVPLRAKGVMIGALGVADRRGREFTDHEAALLQAFADQASLALENARLFSIERARREQIATLADIERELAAVLDPARLPALIVERATGLFKALGVLTMSRVGDDAEPFGAEDLALLQGFAAHAATAIENARLYEEATRYAQRLRALEEVNRLVSSSLEPDEVLANLARAIAQFF